MNSARIALVVASFWGLSLTSSAGAQTASIVGLDNIVVQTGDAPWLADWYEMHQRRSGSVFSPRIEVMPLSGIMGTFALRPNMVALLPASIDLEVNKNGLLRTDAGTSVCLAMVSTVDGLVRGVGDLHAVERRPRIAVTRDVSHIVDWVLGLYNLREKVEWIEVDNERALTGIRMKEFDLAMISASDGTQPKILAHYKKDAVLLALPPSIFSLEGHGFLFVGGFPLEPSHWVEAEREYQSICDPIEAVTTEISRYSETAFKTTEDLETVKGEVGLLKRAYSAVMRLLTIYR